MGIFKDNVAHSFNKYGFRAKTHIPRKYPSEEPIATDKVDQWGHNPPIPGTYENFTAWKNGDNGF